MTLASARVTLKHHRFELGAATFGAVALGAWALWIVVRTAMVQVPPGCFEAWTSAGPDSAGDCASAVRAWGSVLVEEGPRIIAAMGYLPFAVGLLGGIPIVARELEARTAQTAWSLDASRLRWFARQLIPIGLLLSVAIAFVALVTTALEADRVRWGYSAVEDMGLYGPQLVARAFGAFGLGLLVGALVGRSLPALVLAVALSIALVFLGGMAREAWSSGLQPVLVNPADDPTVVVTDFAWIGPDGVQVSREEARALATAAGVPPAAEGDDQDLPAAEWLEANGYEEVALGIPSTTALGWGLYDAAYFGLIGAVSILAAALVVRRKRPT